MKIIHYIFLATALILTNFFSLKAQKNETDFWLTFGDNAYSNYLILNFQIRIVSGDKPTTGVIYFTNLGTPIPFSMAANEVYTYTLDNTQKQAVYNQTVGKSNKSIHITSSEPVKVYALNQVVLTVDATNIFPVEVLNNRYYQISYTPILLDAYAVVAVQDNTKLFHDGIYVETLDAGEVFYLTSSTDMTGSFITTSFPVAFFAVSKLTLIPVGFTAADCLFQQLPPVQTWGKNFFVPVSHLTKERVRIVASKDTTTIMQVDGIFIYSSSGNYTINAGEYIELEALLTNKGCSIQADKPVGVCTYLTGSEYNGLWASDPAQAWLPSIEQFYSKARIAPFIPSGSSALNDHRALVVTPTATKENTTVAIGGGGSTALTGGSWYDNDAAGISFYNMPLTNSTDSYLYSNSNGLIVLCYGTGPAESYYYLAGSAMRDLDAAFYANDVHFQELPDTAFCDKVVNFRAEIENIGVAADSIKWYINGAEYLNARDLLQWSKEFITGEYEIEMQVYFENGETLSKSSTLNVRVFWTSIRNVRH